jgi:hypothetical protein
MTQTSRNRSGDSDRRHSNCRCRLSPPIHREFHAQVLHPFTRGPNQSVTGGIVLHPSVTPSPFLPQIRAALGRRFEGRPAGAAGLQQVGQSLEFHARGRTGEIRMHNKGIR